MVGTTLQVVGPRQQVGDVDERDVFVGGKCSLQRVVHLAVARRMAREFVRRGILTFNL